MKMKVIVTVLLVIALLNFVDVLAVNLIISLGLVFISWLLISSRQESGKTPVKSQGEEKRSFTTDEVESISSAEDTVNDTEVLTAPYINREWVEFEDTVSAMLHEILVLVRAQLHPHSIVLFMPAANGSYHLRAHISESELLIPNAVVTPGEGFLGTYCKEGFPELILDDVGGRKLPHYGEKSGGANSLMIAPVGAVKASAFILVDSTEKNAFSKEDLDWLVDLGKIAGQLLYYGYLYKQHKLMHEQVNAISLLEKKLLMIENRDDLLDELMKNVEELFPFSRCTISLVHDEHDRTAVVERVSGSDPKDISAGDRFSLSEGSLATMTFVNQQPFARNFNTTTDYIFVEKDRNCGFASFAGLPLGRSYGLIFLESDRADIYNSSIMDTLSRIILVAGVALDKIRVLEQQENLAIRDGLTGLYNHRQFQHLLREAIARSHRLMLKSVEEEDGSHYERREEKQPLSLVLCDIDHFKKLNDNHGHRFGDEVLRQIAVTLENGVREGVDYAARYGGEEFALVLFGSDGEQAAETANRVREKIASLPFTTPTGSTINVTMSFGVAVYDKDATRQEELIRKADKALYRAKDKGRNRVEQFGIGSGDGTTKIPAVQA